MGTKIKTTEENLIRDILAHKFSKKDRDDIIAKASILALYNLSDGYNTINSEYMYIKDVPEMKEGASIHFLYSVIKINPKSFLSRKRYGHDLAKVFHESMHYSEYMGAKGEEKGYSTNKGNIAKSRSLLKLILRANYGIGPYDRIGIPANVKLLEKDVNKYLHSIYLLDPSEMKARRFQMDMLEKVVDSGKDMDIKDKNSRANIDSLSVALADLQDMEYIDYSIARKRVELMDNSVKAIIKHARKCVITKDDNGENELSRISRLSKEEYRDYIRHNGDIIEDTLTGILIDYDEECAKELMECILNMEDNYNDNSDVAYTICCQTNYMPTDRQREVMKERAVDEDLLDRVLLRCDTVNIH